MYYGVIDGNLILDVQSYILCLFGKYIDRKDILETILTFTDLKPYELSDSYIVYRVYIRYNNIKGFSKETLYNNYKSRMTDSILDCLVPEQQLKDDIEFCLEKIEHIKKVKDSIILPLKTKSGIFITVHDINIIEINGRYWGARVESALEILKRANSREINDWIKLKGLSYWRANNCI